MKLTFNRADLLWAVQALEHVVPRSGRLPILRHVAIDAVDGRITLTGANGDSMLACEVQGTADSPGAVLVPCSTLGAILRSSEDDEVTLDAERGEVVITAGKSVFRLPTAPQEEFLRIGLLPTKWHCEVAGSLLVGAIAQTIFAADREGNARYAIGGTLLESSHDLLTAVATDGRRLAKSEAAATGELTALLPAKAAALLQKLASIGDTVQMSVANSCLWAQSQSMVVKASLLDGRFPDWRKVLPDIGGVSPITLSVKALGDAVRQAAITTSQDSRGLDVEISDGIIRLTSSAPEAGRAVVEIDSGSDSRPTMRFDHRYLSDYLATVPGDEIMAYVIAPDRPAVFTCGGQTYLLSPMSRE